MDERQGTYCVPASPASPNTPQHEGVREPTGSLKQIHIGHGVKREVDTVDHIFGEDQDSRTLLSQCPARHSHLLAVTRCP